MVKETEQAGLLSNNDQFEALEIGERDILRDRLEFLQQYVDKAGKKLIASLAQEIDSEHIARQRIAKYTSYWFDTCPYSVDVQVELATLLQEYGTRYRLVNAVWKHIIDRDNVYYPSLIGENSTKKLFAYLWKSPLFVDKGPDDDNVRSE